MLGIDFAKTFNNEIVDCKRESGTMGVVPPRARSERGQVHDRMERGAP
jgi:hypothetical protein